MKDNHYYNNRHIPYDICVDILSRLPVKSLVRFMSVSKQWLFMISSDPYFIQKHLFRANQNPNFKHHIWAGYSSYVILDDWENCISLPFTDAPTSHKCNNSNTKVEVLASYNGLLLLGAGKEDHFLWNPSTRSYKKLPGNFRHHRDFFRMYGFGYESSSNVYKVIKIDRVVSGLTVDRDHSPDPYLVYNYDSTNVKVYNFRTNSWSRIEEFPYRVFVDQQGFLVNGAPHWIVARAETEEYVIIYFDLVEERFKEVGSPSWLVFDSAFYLGVLNGFLSLLRKNEVWVMKEHGVKESWTELMTNDKLVLDPSNFAVQVRPICEVTQYRDFVFEEVDYVESLVSPHIKCEITYTIE